MAITFPITSQLHFRLHNWVRANPEAVELLDRLEPESEDEADENQDMEVSRVKPKGKGRGKRSKPARESPPKETEDEVEEED